MARRCVLLWGFAVLVTQRGLSFMMKKTDKASRFSMKEITYTYLTSSTSKSCEMSKLLDASGISDHTRSPGN